MKERLILIGGGGHCKACIDVIEQESRYEIAGILDKAERVGQIILGYPIVGTDNDIKTYMQKGHHFLITIGQIHSPQSRIKLFSALKMLHAPLATVISPRAYVSQHATIGDGTIIMHDALINTDAQIGENCIINTKALIEHDVRIKENCHISTGALINGGTIVRSGTFFGSGAISKEYTQTLNNAFIKAGTVYKGL